ncbi:MAG: DUF1566 domain-containing protein [Halomonadaceae bacterium]|nr:DUF1566 domain-containing protein [Halomonadaceae bacterium]
MMTQTERATSVLRIGAIWALALLAPNVMAQAELWGEAESASEAVETLERSATGLAIGDWVRFSGVGTVFFAGHAKGDVYFADRDEPGGHSWERALDACSRKGPGWQLPAREQLDLLNNNATKIFLHEKGINASSGNWYWSATSINEDEAWRQRFSDGFQQPLKKRFSARVRCIRVY